MPLFQVGSRLYQKCYNITLEILVHYFRMQGRRIKFPKAQGCWVGGAGRTSCEVSCMLSW